VGEAALITGSPPTSGWLSAFSVHAQLQIQSFANVRPLHHGQIELRSPTIVILKPIDEAIEIS
jgi:hypothetical protein